MIWSLLIFFIYSSVCNYTLIVPFQEQNCDQKVYQYQPVLSGIDSFLWVNRGYSRKIKPMFIYLYDSEENAQAKKHYQVIKTTLAGRYSVNMSSTGHYYLYCWGDSNGFNQVFSFSQEGDFIQEIEQNKEYSFSNYTNIKRVHFSFTRALIELLYVSVSKQSYDYSLYYDIYNMNTMVLERNDYIGSTSYFYIDFFEKRSKIHYCFLY